MSSPKVAIVILNWNGWKDTIECLESIYQINYPEFNVIVVDNHSQDKSLQKIKEFTKGKIEVKSTFFSHNHHSKPIIIEEFNEVELETKKIGKDFFNLPSNKKLILIKNDKNYGFAKGNNIGMSYALKYLNADYILLLNNDTVVDPQFLDELVIIAESNDKIGFVGPKTYFYGNKNIIQLAGGGNISLKSGRCYEIAYNQEDKGEYDKNLDLDFIAGSCLLCKKEAIENIGLLDPTFFMYWEDADWCFKGRKTDYKSTYAFKSKIWHKHGTSSNNPFKIYYYYRNRPLFIKRYAKKEEFIHFILYYFIVDLLITSSFYLVRYRDLKIYKATIRGAINGLRLLRVD